MHSVQRLIPTSGCPVFWAALFLGAPCAADCAASPLAQPACLRYYLPIMSDITYTPMLRIQQHKEWGEILVDIETVNRYSVSDEHGALLFKAGEQAGSFLARVMLRALRPFTLVIASPTGHGRFVVERPFRFFFHRADIRDTDGRHLGYVQRHFSVLTRRYTVHDASGRERYELFGPLLHPWTFEIKQLGQTVGKITKRWSGALKEAFTDADNYELHFPAHADLATRQVLLGAVFLIDFVHFENTGSSR